MQVDEAFEIPVFLDEIYHRLHLHFRVGMWSMVYLRARVVTGPLSCGEWPKQKHESIGKKTEMQDTEPRGRAGVAGHGQVDGRSPLYTRSLVRNMWTWWVGRGVMQKREGIGSATAEEGKLEGFL